MKNTIIIRKGTLFQVSAMLFILFIITGCGGDSSSHTENQTESVFDNKTTLTWMDSDETESRTKTFSQAEEYCQKLQLDHYNDWRVPNIQELSSIVDREKFNPSIINIFQHRSALSYWSSEHYAMDNNLMFGINFYDGSNGVTLKTTPHYIRCVRGHILPMSSFSKSEEDTVVEDTKEWQDNSEIENNFFTYAEASSYCNKLVLSDSNDWRLPSITELHSIVDRSRFNPAINQNFTHAVNGFFWSKTPYQAESNKMWTIFFADGNDYQQSKNKKAYVRCIKNSKKDKN